MLQKAVGGLQEGCVEAAWGFRHLENESHGLALRLK